MNKTVIASLAAVAAFASAPAVAQSFTSTFENVPGGPSFGGYTTVAEADGWTGGPGGIELQNHVAGNPAANGGDVFVELDTGGNSEMFRSIAAGTYALSFLYSPRPGVPFDSNGIEVLLNGTSIFTTSGSGGTDTAWSTIVVPSFTALADSTLTFRAIGTSDSLGGYIDNITLTAAVPEPATWGLMILGFGAVGATLRRRSAKMAIA